MERTFPSEVLLSITTGRLLCDFNKMHECCEFLAGGPIWTHQFAYKPFVDQLKSAVLAQHPQLDNPEITTVAIGELLIALENTPGEDVEALLSGWAAKRVYPVVGHELPLIPMAAMVTEAKAAFTEPLKGKQVIVLTDEQT